MLYLIGEFATRTGLTARALRLYDRLGLVPARRDPTNGHRYYTDADLLGARRVRLLRTAGFSLREIVDLLVVLARPEDRDAALEPFRARLRALQDERTALQTQQQTLRQLLSVLAASEDIDEELTRLAEVDPHHRRTLMQTIHHRAATLSARGPRARNEDHTFHADTDTGGLYLVADGMGGHDHGAEASSRACDAVAEHLDPQQLRPDAWARHLRAVVDAANAAVLTLHDPAARERRRARSGPEATHGPGSTLAVLVLHDGVAYLTSVGDTRIYRQRDGELVRLTRDHSVVQRRVEEGELSAEEAETHPERNLLTSAVGVDEAVAEVFVHREEATAGTRYLLVSDGVTRALSDAEIATGLAAHPDPDDAVRALIEAAERSTDDNATALVVDV